MTRLIRNPLPTTLGLFALAAPIAAQGATYRVSLDSLSRQADHRSVDAAVSADGLWVAFASRATNLVPGDNNNTQDIFVKDLITGATRRVSVSSAGAEANATSYNPAISGDGRYIAFESDASNLVAGDNNGFTDVFVHDRISGQTTRVSVSSAGAEANSYSSHPSLSADGRLIAFTSMASNLVGGDNNGFMDVFVRDRQTGQTVRVSVSTQGTEGDDDSYTPSMSSDGRWVAFGSGASTLVAGDSNGFIDIFVRDLQRQETHIVSRGAGGTQANGDSYDPDISAGGRYVAFHSDASNLVAGDTNGWQDVFRVDRNTMTALRASVSSQGAQGDAASTMASMSDDGRYLAFQSDAGNLTPQTSFATDIYVHDFATQATSLHSLTSDGLLAQDQNCCPSLSGNGRYLAFQTWDDGLVPDDTNGWDDIVVNEVSHHLEAAGPARIGRTTSLTLHSPRDAGRFYAALAAFNTQFGIRLGGRLFPLDNDALLLASTSMPSVFGNFLGFLDANGEATVTVTMPNSPAFVNFELAVAYTVIDPGFPTGFLGMSNARFFLVAP